MLGIILRIEIKCIKIVTQRTGREMEVYCIEVLNTIHEMSYYLKIDYGKL